MWLGRREGEERISHRDKMVDSVMGVRRPTFKRTYNATRLNSNYLYNSITMMLVGHGNNSSSCDLNSSDSSRSCDHNTTS